MIDKSLRPSVAQFSVVLIRHWKVYASGAAVGVIGWFIDFQEIPRGIFAAGLIGLTLIAVFHGFHDLRVERDTHKEKLDAIEASRPKLRCRGQKYVPFYEKGTYRFHVLQVWICNEPETRTLSSLAKNVSNRVAYYREGVTPQAFEVGSQWVSAFDPDAASYSGILQQVDIPANDIPAKFNLILQHSETDQLCYAHSFAKLPGQPDGRYTPYRLPPGRYRIVLHLKGDNVDQELELRFVNHGLDADPELIGIPKQNGSPQPSRASGPDTCPSCGHSLPD